VALTISQRSSGALRWARGTDA